jgi:uncharacterized protein YdeI (YjbR/CyaY-like superfamily)
MAAAKKRAPRTRAAERPKTGTVEFETLTFADVEAWGRWLAANHASSPGIRLKIAKKGCPEASVTYAEAVEVSLAWGWIDGQKGAIDDWWWLQRFTPRGPRSPWSKINRDKALALIASGAMKAPGLAEVERAKRDGRWDAAYASQSRAVVPPDLAAALAANRRAARFFETLEAHNRYAILYRVHTAKKPETRARRIATFVAMLARHEKLHP